MNAGLTHHYWQRSWHVCFLHAN